MFPPLNQLLFSASSSQFIRMAESIDQSLPPQASACVLLNRHGHTNLITIVAIRFLAFRFSSWKRVGRYMF